MATKKGREEIGSLAKKIGSSKKLAEKYALDLVAVKKAEVKAVDTDRIQFCKKMDSLRDDILAPRDAWEQAEKDRVSGHKQCIQDIRDMLKEAIELGFNSNQIQSSINHLENIIIDFEGWEEFTQEAHIAKLETLELLRKALAEREKYEAEQAELEAKRQAEALRQQQEHDAQIAREAAEKATREAEEKARLEAERVQREKLEAEQREARLKAEKEAAELREQALKQKAIDDAKQAEIAKQQAIEAERKRIEAEQFAQAEAVRKAQEAREANVAHKKQICSEALKGLTDLGVDEELGKEILRAINKGLVPHVSIKF